MHNQLETYLEQLAHGLQSLPPEQREAELSEMRHHLESLATQLIENGESPQEAMRSAIHQFGQPSANGKDLRWAWRRGHNRAKRQALKRNFHVVVGTRQGRVVIHWPGVLYLSAVIVTINVVLNVVISFALTREFFFLASSLAFGIPMQLGTIVVLGIRRALQMDPDQLTPLD
jgi:uncharacterized membrane protein